METFSALLALCAGNSPVPGEFPTQRPVTRGFDVYFDMRPNKRLSKQSLGWWFETLSPPLWRHRNAARLKQFQSLPIGWHIINMFGEKIVTIVHFEGFSEEQSILTNSIITPVKLAFGVDKINNKLNFCMELGNIVRDHLSKVPKNPRPASWDIANIRNDLQP